ncbi:MAG: type 1 glutamine amidotransferase [Bacteroidota bacterium]
MPMAPEYAQLRIRLIQIRDRESVRLEEQQSFRDRTQLRADQILVTSAITDDLHAGLLDDVDAVMIGGAGAYSVTETFGWTQDLIDVCQACADREMPLFGSCWGHQFIARAFGGTVINDSERSEMGTVDVDLTDAGRQDPLFSTLPDPFGTQMGHHDRVSVLPKDATELAKTDVAPYQAIRIGDLPIYGTQFHSELDEHTERGRLITYRSYYPEMADDAIFQATLDGLRPSPDADDLLHRFLLLFAVAGGEALLAEQLSLGEPGT